MKHYNIIKIIINAKETTINSDNTFWIVENNLKLEMTLECREFILNALHHCVKFIQFVFHYEHFKRLIY